MAKTTVLVKFPGQALCYTQVPTDRIEEIHKSIAGLQSAEVDVFSLYRNFYYILLDRDRMKKRLPSNMTAFLVDGAGESTMMDIAGVFVICKLPKGTMHPLSDMTPQDVEQVLKLLKK
ncbi:hypothetical protein [Oscillibacter ruminantium]|jgi:hypothetical protein|uniref:hypothetical protein n=1 Tax=Oscillibacter ruminantium TaxID=1263547 RepID=UPI0002D5BBDC|nr:hypothetical protein [Oscillibacter ruminantium]MDN0032068.1 hypothetical protein [Oscillibacter valericigenes]MEA5041240.1 hypothetical protein [Oscillibacter ruminantium]